MRTATDFLSKYQASLSDFPAPGTGAEAHGKLVTVANYGVAAGISAKDLFDDIKGSIPPGKRRIEDREITSAINLALKDFGTFTPQPRPEPITKDGATRIRKIIATSQIRTIERLRELSPVRILDDERDNALLMLMTLFYEDELVFIGDRGQTGIMGTTIRRQHEWVQYFKAGGATAPFIIMNPLSGKPAPLKSDPTKSTYRGDGNVVAYRIAVVEFDNLSMEDQVRFWGAIRLPVIALVGSGGKSLHGWIDVQKLFEVTTAEEWDTHIGATLYDRMLVPLGVDRACKNAARLTRLPGHLRDGGRQQRLLWLAREGVPVWTT